MSKLNHFVTNENQVLSNDTRFDAGFGTLYLSLYAQELWGGALWSPSYFAGSCGGAPIEIIRQYIEQQQTPT